MTAQNFLIGPINDGLRKDAKPWSTPEDSFQYLLNAFQWRGRIVKKSGYTSLARLSPDGTTFPGLPVMGLPTRELFGLGLQQLIGFDTTSTYFYNTTTNQFNTLASVMPVTWSGTNYDFFWTTNYAGGFWATNSKEGLNGYNLATVNTFTGATATTVNVMTATANTFQVGDQIYFLNSSVNNLRFGEVTVAGNPFTFMETDGEGDLSDGNSVTGMALSTSRTVPNQDGIRYYAETEVGNTWVNYNPPVDPNNALAGALLIFAYRGYLVFLNTTEGNDQGTYNYGNRARWTQIGTPYYSDPVPVFPAPQTVDPDAVRDDLFGRGGANDAPTSEVIVSAGFVRDILIVYFERSTWRLRFVNNTQNPFVWERVNIELGSDCTFSNIIFDKGLMTIGDRGIVISDGNDTIRFDEKIPNDIFKIRVNNEGFQRVNGIRTFRTRLCYWTYPSDTNPTGIFPDQVLVFNYDTKNWAYFDDCFTCFGYFYPGGLGLTWNNLTDPWNTYNNVTWDSGVNQAGYENVIAGNQQGFVFILETDNGTNAPSLTISNIVGSTVTSNNHNLKDGDWITLSGVTGTTYADGTTLNGQNFKVANPTLDANIFTLTAYRSITAGTAIGSSFSGSTGFIPIIPGSVQINVGSLIFTDPMQNGTLTVTGSNSGSINYQTGAFTLNFNPSLGVGTPVYFRSVSNNQTISPIGTTGAYGGGGLIAKISNFDIQTKDFNFFGQDKRARLSKIDFYVDTTATGQCTVNIYADGGFDPVNTPMQGSALSPGNPQSNILLTSANPYQFGNGEETIFRMWADAVGQTLSFEFTMSDAQMAVSAINSQDFELLAMNISLRQGGRLV